MAVTHELRDGVLVVTLAAPPVNALGLGVRQGLLAALDAAAADPSVRAVVLGAEGRVFSAGADIAEFGRPAQAPLLATVCDRIEALGLPVVAALDGAALGGGCELALAATARIASPRARLGLPEVTLGLLPGAGGTRRLPRLVGAAVALDLMLGGRPLDAGEALVTGLLDRVTEAPLGAAAETFARELIDTAPAAPVDPAPPAAPAQDPAAWIAAVAAARTLPRDPDLPAPGRIIDCVEAALLLPDAAHAAFERMAFEDCLASDAAAGLRHAFFAERRAARGAPDAAARAVARAGVAGGGLMGAGIAAALLAAGLPVTLLERDRGTLEAALLRIDRLQETAVARGKLEAAAREAAWGRLTGTLAVEDLAPSDLVIEAVPEDAGLKADLLARLGRAAPGAILATNTSYLAVDALAAAVPDPTRVLGLHFFSPVHAMRLVEVVPGHATRPDVTATGFALARRLGKVAVRAGAAEGFIGNRILTAYRGATDRMLLAGATPAGVDAAMRGYGFAAGPYETLDRAGLDISWARRRRAFAAAPPPAGDIAILDRLCAAGALGRKAGRGYYDYGGARPVPNPEAAAAIAAERSLHGVAERGVTAAEIARAALAAIVNEGARLLADGTARAASDIDAVLLLGYGFPRRRGGPMHAADRAGLLGLRRDLARWAATDPFWTPAPMLAEMIKNGTTFASLDG